MKSFSRICLGILVGILHLKAYPQQIDLSVVRAQEEFRWGVEAFHRGYLNESIVSLKRSLAFRPNEYLVRVWLARAFLQSGFEEAGLAELKSVASQRPGDLFVRNWVELLESGRGLRRELRPESRWVFAGEIEGVRGENVFFKGPTTVRARRDGTFYVVSYITNNILLTDINGIPIRSLRGGIEGFDHPFDVVETASNTLFVSEFRGDRIALCNANGFKIKVLGGRGRQAGALLGPQYLFLDSRGNLYVTEAGNRRVSKFNLDGDFLTTFGERSTFFEGLLAPTGIVVWNDKVIVADKDRKYLAVFDTNGNYLTTLLKGRLTGPEGLSLMDNQVLITDNNRLLNYDIETDTLKPLIEYGAQAKKILLVEPDANGNLLASDFESHSIHILSELSELYAGLNVKVQRVRAAAHPEVYLEVRVSDRFQRPIVGLRDLNFVISEQGYRVVKPELLFTPLRTDKVDVAFLVDRSLKALDARETLARVGAEIGNALRGKGELRVVSASAKPELTLRPEDPLGLVAERVRDIPSSYTPNWAFDLGARFATTELMMSQFRKALIFLTTGELSPHSFQNFGLNETLTYMRNNGVVFYPVYLTQSGTSRELEYLARETGGKVYRYPDPKGISSLISDLLQQKEGLYVLKYVSREDTDFGRRYLPVEVEVRLVQRSGKDEIGYFGPLKF
ncbi:MAG: hypothetical protein SNJ78_02600 [Spirochaetales bacterium]